MLTSSLTSCFQTLLPLLLLLSDTQQCCACKDAQNSCPSCLRAVADVGLLCVRRVVFGLMAASAIGFAAFTFVKPIHERSHGCTP